MTWWEALFLGISFLVVLVTVGYSLRVGISPMPSGRSVVQSLLTLLPKDTQGTVVDLGSGWGSLVFAVARRIPQAQVVGIELSPLPYVVSRIRGAWVRNERISWRREDFFQSSLEDASVVLCYLYTGAMQRLQHTLLEKLKPGTMVISHTFALPNWTPSQVVRVNDLYRTPIYVYHVPHPHNDEGDQHEPGPHP